MLILQTNKKNAFYFIWKALFVLKILLSFSPELFGHVGKRPDKKVEVNFESYDVIDWEINNYNTRIAQYLKKKYQLDNNYQLINYSMRNIFIENHAQNALEKLILGPFLKIENLVYL